MMVVPKERKFELSLGGRAVGRCVMGLTGKRHHWRKGVTSIRQKRPNEDICSWSKDIISI